MTRAPGLTWRNISRHSMRDNAARLSLAICCLGCVFFLAAHLIWDDNSAFYLALTGALAVLCGLLTIWAKTCPRRAVVSFWWFVLIVTASMVVVDMQAHASDGLPGIVYIPTVGTVIIRLLAGLRPTGRYAVGVLSLLIPTGAIYNEWAQVGALAGAVILAVTFRGRKREGAAELRKATSLLETDNERRASGLQERRE